jgi:hypothetical protein
VARFWLVNTGFLLTALSRPDPYYLTTLDNALLILSRYQASYEVVDIADMLLFAEIP